MQERHQFGGAWTRDKLVRLEKYLRAYTVALQDKGFTLAYIDAFAGTGSVEPSSGDEIEQSMLDAISGEESKDSLMGSAAIALQVDPPFDHYIFIDRNKKHVAELEGLKEEYPLLAPRIEIRHGEANQEVRAICAKDWSRHRAVLFLDPYGMQVEWATLEAIAKTRAIDLWILFPSAIGVSRLLTRDCEIPTPWSRRLTLLFGSDEWRRRFYSTKNVPDFFGDRLETERDAPLAAIGEYFIERLRTIFLGGVAKNPLTLTTPSGRPLYLLCFAAGNVNGGKVAIKIAQDILKR